MSVDFRGVEPRKYALTHWFRGISGPKIVPAKSVPRSMDRPISSLIDHDDKSPIRQEEINFFGYLRDDCTRSPRHWSVRGHLIRVTKLGSKF